ncbi:MAG TPA: type VI secretion system lipoprotein TssJ [Lamprocystis sp. (in: g-proteobacteria)]|nr:type VI secretion system lipoprotein TssJ [Lamprocystis sp. (in: g-proteobacteria)]
MIQHLSHQRRGKTATRSGRPWQWQRQLAPLLAALVLPLAMTATLVAVPGCAGKPPPPPPKKEEKPAPELRAEVIAAPGANRDPSGRALPIVVRLYELKAEGAFAGADFYKLYDHEAETLGAELIGREEVTLVPGSRRLVVRPLSPEASYLGVIGAFRDIDRASWRTLVALTRDQTNTIQVDVGATGVTAAAR